MARSPSRAYGEWSKLEPRWHPLCYSSFMHWRVAYSALSRFRQSLYQMNIEGMLGTLGTVESLTN